MECKRYIGCAIRGRYTDDGATTQKLEINSDKFVNTITSVQKDSLIIEVNETMISSKK